MSTTIIFVGIVVFAFVVGRALDRFSSKLLLLSGAEHVAIGAGLAPFLPLDRLSLDERAAIDLVISIVLGMAGFFVGLRIRLGRAGREAMLAGATAALAVIFVVGLASTEVVELLHPSLGGADPLMSEPLFRVGGLELWLWMTPVALWVGLTVGAAAGGSSAAVVELVCRRFVVSDTRSTFLVGMAATAEVMALFAFGIAMAASRATTSAGALGLSLLEWALVTLLAGACTGLLFIVFIGRDQDAMRINIATIGVIVFAAGVGTALGVSALLVNLIAGLTVGTIYGKADALEAKLRPLWLPSSVMVLLFAGLAWVPASGWSWALAPGYAAVRLLCWRSASRVAVATFADDKTLSVGIGRGLLAQGVVAAAISLAFAQRFPDMAPIVTTTILGGLLLSDLVAARSLRRYLADVGEIHPTDSRRPQSTEVHP